MQARVSDMAKAEATGFHVLAARAAAADLVHAYAKNVREGTGAVCGELFTQDAVFEVRQAPSFGSPTYTTRSKVEGREAITAYITRSAAPEARVCPSISNLIVTVEGARASSSVMTNLTQVEGLQTIGEYYDTYRYAGDWLFSSRIFTIIASARADEDRRFLV